MFSSSLNCIFCEFILLLRLSRVFLKTLLIWGGWHWLEKSHRFWVCNSTIVICIWHSALPACSLVSFGRVFGSFYPFPPHPHLSFPHSGEVLKFLLWYFRGSFKVIFIYFLRFSMCSFISGEFVNSCWIIFIIVALTSLSDDSSIRVVSVLICWLFFTFRL